jgi:hypothetical protein
MFDVLMCKCTLSLYADMRMYMRGAGEDGDWGRGGAGEDGDWGRLRDPFIYMLI